MSEVKKEVIIELKFYDTSEIAEILGVTTKTVSRYIQDGKVKAQKIGRKWVIHENDLKDFLNVK